MLLLPAEHDIALLRVLTDRGTEYCGNPEHHEYELYLAVPIPRLRRGSPGCWASGGAPQNRITANAP